MKEGPLKENFWLKVGAFLIAFLLLGNFWFAYDIIHTSKIKNLPQLKFNPIGATSFLFSQRDTSDEEKSNITWQEEKNILILGRSGEGYKAPHLTDSIIVLHINPKTNKPLVRLISIPRDLLVKVNETGDFLKINSLFSYGNRRDSIDVVSLIKKKVEDITSLKINSIIVFDLSTVEKIVEKTDGLTVFVKEDIYDPRFPTKSGGYELFSLQKGWRYLNEEDVIKFIRTRYSPLGDFDRIGRQQETLQSLKGKITSLNPIWDFPTLWSIFKTLRNELITDLNINDLKNIWFAFEEISFRDIETLSIDTTTDLVKPKTINMGGVPAYVLVAMEKDFNYNEIREAVASFILK